MKYLLDTHTLIWALSDVKKLPSTSKIILADTKNLCYVSIASFWELAIKKSLGKIELKRDLKFYFEITKQTGFKLLSIRSKHIICLSGLHNFHNDPFDRIIISQAVSEKFIVITRTRPLIYIQ